jgi:hypothetical protein
MLLKISCTCGRVGAVSDALLPRELVCSHCGSARLVEAEHCRPIVSLARFEEYIAGERERPQPRRNIREPLGRP